MGKNKNKPGNWAGARRDRLPTRREAAGQAPHNRDFVCTHCNNPVTTNPLIAGVNNRNHCPYCLWSRHVDAQVAGDRLAACKAGMRPVALTWKRVKKKYASNNNGELMLVHVCTGCDKVSINRIAADDDNHLIEALFQASVNMPEAEREGFAQQGIDLVTAEDRPAVERLTLSPDDLLDPDE